MTPKARHAQGKTARTGRKKAAGRKAAEKLQGTWALLYEYPKDSRYVVVEGKTGRRSVFPKEPLDVPAR